MPLSRALACAAALLCAAPAALAYDHRFEIGAGVLDEIEGESGQNYTFTWYPRQGEWPIAIMVAHLTEREVGADGFGSPAVNFLSASLHRQWDHLYLGFGVAVVDDQSEVLSSAHQFLSSIGWRFGDFSVSLRHISNGNTGGRNRGDNLLTLNYGF